MRVLHCVLQAIDCTALWCEDEVEIGESSYCDKSGAIVLPLMGGYGYWALKNIKFSSGFNVETGRRP